MAERRSKGSPNRDKGTKPAAHAISSKDATLRDSAKPQSAGLGNRSRATGLSVTLAPQHALTDQMIERLATTGGNALEVLDRLNDEATNETVHRLIDRLTEMEKVGSLDTAFDLAMLPHAMRSALTDAMVERLSGYAEYLITNLANEDVIDLVARSTQAMNEAVEESKKAPAGGLLATLSMLSKPETHRGLLFLLSFAEKLQHRLSGGSSADPASGTAT